MSVAKVKLSSGCFNLQVQIVAVVCDAFFMAAGTLRNSDVARQSWQQTGGKG